MNKSMLCLVSMMFAMGGNAQASPVTVTGEFTSFSSSLTPPNSVPAQTFVNGVAVTVPADGSVFTVPLSPGVNSVGFWETDFGGNDLTHNLAEFTPGPVANVVVGQEFLLGTFTFTNGTWFGETNISFSMTSHSSDPSLDGHTFTDVLHFHLNPFVAGNPAAGADVFSFVGRPDLGSVPVYEAFDSPTGSNTGTIQLLGKIDSLDPTRFANASGGLFLVPATVPEPGILSLVGAGLFAVAFMRRLTRTAQTRSC